ncbi:MAG: acetyl-CoA hydrolase/transferase family protein [Deltaproteobacteria bacterium]|nr:acetyl-CoA hydrolase/transferase family protein [Deltaproteobacteria bacterium]
MRRLFSAAEAVQCIQSGHRVFIHGGAATPISLVEAMVEQADRLRDVEVTHLHTSGEAAYGRPQYQESFRVANLFVGGNLRKYVGTERNDYVPVFLSEIPRLFREGRRHINVAMLQVSPPDSHGYVTLGPSVDVAMAAAESADVVVAEINPRMPRTHGDGFLHVSRIDFAIDVDRPLPESPPTKLGEEERAIGEHVASLVDDGATLQMGIGAVPDAVLAALTNHKHLGIHTEMVSDGVLPLIECGAVDNSRKEVHPDKVVAGFATGSRKLYDYIDDNPAVVLLDIAYVNRPTVIARNPKVTAINSAVEVDLTGQVCADSIGHRIISGVGGQLDFMRGAALSPGGKPIIALTSRAKKGESRIVPTLRPGSGVVTTRMHVHYVVTEFGVADLFGKSFFERAKALTSIAHPEVRDDLERDWQALARKS